MKANFLFAVLVLLPSCALHSHEDAHPGINPAEASKEELRIKRLGVKGTMALVDGG